MKKNLLIFLLILTLSITSAHAKTLSCYTNISDISVYADTDYSSEVKDVLKLNSKLEIISESDEWYKVKTEDGKTGWIEKYFVTVPATKYVVNNSTYKINIRKSATTSSSLVGQLLPGDKVKYVDTYHSWHIIEYNGEEYYVASWLTDVVASGDEKVYLLGDKINIRSEASLTSEVVAQGSKSDSYYLLEEKNGWLKIQLKDGQIGYIAGWLTSYNINEGNFDYKETTTNLNIRTDNSTSAEKISTLTQNEIVKVISTENGWDKVITKDGQIGWCNNSYLKESLPLSGKKILLDPGHGGKDPGAISFTGKYEKNINLTVTYKLKERLESLGAKVYMTRTDDTYINNTQRGRMADSLGVDILLSIHHNSLGNRDYFGLSTYYNTIKYKNPRHGYDLAEAIYLNAITMNGVYRDGILDRNFEVLRETNTPAALIEIGFMSNPEEEIKIHDDSFQNIMIEKIAKGILDYFK